MKKAELSRQNLRILQTLLISRKKKEEEIKKESDDEEEYDVEIEEDARLSEEKFLPSGAKIVSGDAGNLFSKPAS